MEKCLLKNVGFDEKEIELLREKFIIEYAKKKNWNPFSLTTEQLLEIKQQKGYQSPGMILS